MVDLGVTCTVAKPPLKRSHQEDRNWIAIQVSTQANLKRVKTEEVNAMEHKHNDKVKCVVCQDEERVILVLPCSHLDICRECVIAVSDCPTCRTKIDKRVSLKIN